jgi:hypothetical protein
MKSESIREVGIMDQRPFAILFAALVLIAALLAAKVISGREAWGKHRLFPTLAPRTALIDDRLNFRGRTASQDVSG